MANMDEIIFELKATADGGEVPGSLGSIVAKIKPSVDKAKASSVASN